MMALMPIYTRTGDEGQTSLVGGERVKKSTLRVEAYGTVDEANSALGLARSHLPAELSDLDALLDRLQRGLFDLGSDLATLKNSPAERYVERIDADDVAELEAEIDRLEAELPPLKLFILPGGHPAAAALHLARTVTRRAERVAVALADEEWVNPEAIRYLNRLSDLLFVLSRYVNHRLGVEEPIWRARRERR